MRVDKESHRNHVTTLAVLLFSFFICSITMMMMMMIGQEQGKDHHHYSGTAAAAEEEFQKSRQLTHWFYDGSTDDFRTGYNCRRISNMIMPTRQSSGSASCQSWRAPSPCEASQMTTNDTTAAQVEGPVSTIITTSTKNSNPRGNYNNNNTADEHQHVDKESCEGVNVNGSKSYLTRHDIEIWQHDPTCFQRGWLTMEILKGGGAYADEEEEHTRFRTSYVSSLDPYGKETARKCRLLSTSVQQVIQSLVPTTRYDKTATSIDDINDDNDDNDDDNNKERIDLCLQVESSWKEHNLTCTMEVNGQKCNSCQITPCHAFFGPEYLIDCSNLVKGATEINTCHNLGVDHNVFRFWDLTDDWAYLRQCQSSSSTATRTALGMTIILATTTWATFLLTELL